MGVFWGDGDVEPEGGRHACEFVDDFGVGVEQALPHGLFFSAVCLIEGLIFDDVAEVFAVGFCLGDLCVDGIPHGSEEGEDDKGDDDDGGGDEQDTLSWLESFPCVQDFFLSSAEGFGLIHFRLLSICLHRCGV